MAGAPSQAAGRPPRCIRPLANGRESRLVRVNPIINNRGTAPVVRVGVLLAGATLSTVVSTCHAYPPWGFSETLTPCQHAVRVPDLDQPENAPERGRRRRRRVDARRGGAAQNSPGSPSR